MVTTTQVQHASPAATYAHTPSRSWYSDNAMSIHDIRNGCKDIALQLVEQKRNINVSQLHVHLYRNEQGYRRLDYSIARQC